MDKIKIKNIFAAVSDKSILDPLLKVLHRVRPFGRSDPGNGVHFWGTEGTVRYLRSRGFSAQSVVSGFDFDGRVKTLDRNVFTRVLADRAKKHHMEELWKLSGNTLGVSQGAALRTPGVSKREDWDPFDLVIVDLYPLEPKTFPESMDIGGQALIRAAIKNYKNVALAFDEKSLSDLVKNLKTDQVSTDLAFRKKQAAQALKFIAKRCSLEAKLL